MIRAGDRLPVQHRTVTARDIILGATASRDWQPQHHDHAHALAMNLPGIIMNTPTQTGWFHAYALHWAGAGARIGRWRLKMAHPVCPDARVTLSGEVGTIQDGPHGTRWLELALRMADEGGADLSTMALVLCVPAADDGSCWHLSGDDWAPPLLGPEG